ncbi:MAG TPA: hypothetical protein VNZ22_18875, partial [Bacillota bacterium]|nr:hypothetical protein [Bacillota bacterium]
MFTLSSGNAFNQSPPSIAPSPLPRLAQLALCLASVLLISTTAQAAYYQVDYPSTNTPGQLQLGVSYTVWIPATAKTLRGVIVHQHGCGTGACEGGATAAYDLHWQALARKWDCALLGPSYHQTDKEDCGLWCDPKNGSEQKFLQALADLAAQSGHPELAQVPWCLWGHSGGGFWAGEMHCRHPERVVAVWQRSGAARFFREKDPTQIPPAVYQVPVVCNPGVKEQTDRFAKIYDGMLEMFRAYRAQGAPICFAPDPRTSHECGDSRYLAIPFFDTCLAMRLPPRSDPCGKLQPVNWKKAWLAPLLSDKPQPARDYSGPANEAVWLPDATVAKAWAEYVRTGAVSDTTPPPAPIHAKASKNQEGTTTLTWNTEADLESGVGGFVILRDGVELAKLPEKPVGHFGRPLFQTMSYHDTPEKPLPEMRFTDIGVTPGKHRYEIIAVNSAGLQSRPVRCKQQL